MTQIMPDLVLCI